MSMVVTDLDLGGINSLPMETDPPLVVNPDGMPSGSVSPEGLQSVARRNPQIGELSRGIKLNQLTKRNSRDPRKAGTRSSLMELLCLGIFEGGNHGCRSSKPENRGGIKRILCSKSAGASISKPQNKASVFTV